MFFLALDRCKRGGGGFFLVLVFRIHSIVVVVVVVSWMFLCCVTVFLCCTIQRMDWVVAKVSGFHEPRRFNLIKLISHASAN